MTDATSNQRNAAAAAPATGDSQEMRCRVCPGREFRRSRLRVKDLWRLLILRYPVRCLRCRQRQSVSVFAAARAESSKARIQETPEPAETWRNWTMEPRGEGQPTLKPFVPGPAAGPVAVPSQVAKATPTRVQPIGAPPQSTRIAIVAPPKDDDENAIW
jgi:hypothetical protein